MIFISSVLYGITTHLQMAQSMNIDESKEYNPFTNEQGNQQYEPIDNTEFKELFGEGYKYVTEVEFKEFRDIKNYKGYAFSLYYVS